MPSLNKAVLAGQAMVGRRHPTQVDVEVRDTGAGVDEAMRTEIFKQFVTTKSRGMGLGLSISKGILDAHEGRIVLEATGPTGTLFRFSLAAQGT